VCSHLCCLWESWEIQVKSIWGLSPHLWASPAPRENRRHQIMECVEFMWAHAPGSWSLAACLMLYISISQCVLNIVLSPGSLEDPCRNPKNTVIEDQFVRKFILGTWYKIWVSEVVLKRRHNNLIICGMVCPLPSMSSIYFLKGYTEQLLSQLLKLNVQVQVQCVENRKTVVHKLVWASHLLNQHASLSTDLRFGSNFLYIAK